MTALLLLSALLLLLLIIIGFMLSFIFNIIPMLLLGAFFAPTSKETVEKIISLSDIKLGEKAIDLGSGDGRLVIALAEAGAEAEGYEINPILVWLSKRNIKKSGLKNRAFVYYKNFWKEDFSKFNVVIVFGISYMMKKLEKKLKKELKPGARVVSNYFIFPEWKYSKKQGNVYLYEK